jgi:hypothetical protein
LRYPVVYSTDATKTGLVGKDAGMERTQLDQLSEERIARNDATFRNANEEIEEVALSLDRDGEAHVPFICECADRSCTQIVRISLGEYEVIRAHPRRFLNALGHHVAAHGAAVVVDQNDRFCVVEKIGHAGEVAERLDSRSADSNPQG